MIACFLGIAMLIHFRYLRRPKFLDLMDRSFGVNALLLLLCVCMLFVPLHFNTDYLPLIDVDLVLLFRKCHTQKCDLLFFQKYSICVIE